MKKLALAFTLAVAAAGLAPTTGYTAGTPAAPATQNVDFAQRLRDRLNTINIESADISKEYAKANDLEVPDTFDLAALLVPLGSFSTNYNGEEINGEQLLKYFEQTNTQIKLAIFSKVNNINYDWQREQLSESDAHLDTYYDETGEGWDVLVINANATPREQQAAIWQYLLYVYKQDPYLPQFIDITEADAAGFPGVPDAKKQPAPASATTQPAPDNGQKPGLSPAS